MSEAIGDPGHEIVGRGAFQAYLESTRLYAAREPSFQQDALMATQALGADNLYKLVALHARYDHPGVSTERDGTQRDASHRILHQFLKVIPSYAEGAALAGLTPEQATELVQTLLAEEERGEWTIADPPVLYLGRALEAQARTHGPLTGEDYEQVRSLIADTASHEDDNASALDVYRALSRLGMTTLESVEFIRGALLTDSMLMNPALAVFNALSIAEVDTQVLTAVCRRLIGTKENHPHISDIQSDFARLRECFVTVGPGQDMHPNEVLTTIYTWLNQGKSMSEVMEEFIATKRLQTAAGDTYHPKDRINRHFLAKSVPLELSPLPYRVERSFEEGVRDLGVIALHDMHYREPVEEGFWIFDRDASRPTWYSLGGETEIRIGAVGHHYPVYPLQELSKNPAVLHCHPAGLEWAISPGRNNGVYPNIALPVIDRFLAATPSRRDYAMIAEMLRMPDGPQSVRSLFVHGSGMTEYTFPQDAEALGEMAQSSQALRYDMLRRIDWSKVLYKRRFGGLLKGERRETNAVVRELVERFDSMMPSGFGLRLLDIEASSPTH